MNVAELFRRLSYEKLSTLAMAAEGTGTILADHKAKIISLANSGLTRLYSRFVLKESDLLLQQQAHITNYQFSKKFAVNAPQCDDALIRYIFDKPAQPFQGDLLKILKVVDSMGVDHPLNDIDDIDSYFTPTPTTLQIPRPVQGKMVNVIYQAAHPTLSYTDFEACIELPLVLEEALLSWIAGSVFSGMTGQENLAKGQEQFALYEAVCNGVTEMDMVNSSSSQSGSKFESRGFR